MNDRSLIQDAAPKRMYHAICARFDSFQRNQSEPVIAPARDSPLLDWATAMLPRHFRLPSSEMHRWLGKQLDAMRTRRGARVNLIGPRGHAKSTVVTLAYVLRAAVEQFEPYIWIVSDTRSQAATHLENIKSELLGNDQLAEAYLDAVGKGPRWRARAIELANGAVIEAFGTGQKLRGRRRRHNRPTLIICDDLENDEHSNSAERRRKSLDWFQNTLLKAGTKRTNVVNLATALHPDALALRLDRTPGWTSRVYRALSSLPSNTKRWHEWEAIYVDLENPHAKADAERFYREHRAEMDAGARPLWPEEEDLYTLMRMRVEGGRAAFDREKQGSPLDPESCEWPEEYFAEHIWFDEWPRHFRAKTIALDPSKGADARRGDYSAFVLLGVDSAGVLYVEADLARRNTAQMVADGVEHDRRFRPDAFGVESNQFQQLLAPAFVDEFRRQGMFSADPWQLNNSVNKLVRIRRLGPYLAAKRMRFKTNSPGTGLLVDQLRSFPHADHDDGPDALEMALRMASQIMAPAVPDDGLGDRLI